MAEAGGLINMNPLVSIEFLRGSLITIRHEHFWKWTHEWGQSNKVISHQPTTLAKLVYMWV